MAESKENDSDNDSDGTMNRRDFSEEIDRYTIAQIDIIFSYLQQEDLEATGFFGILQKIIEMRKQTPSRAEYKPFILLLKMLVLSIIQLV
jgi:hypothetical protein